jgi:nucleotide-binding universal stress UspA family protein
MYRKILVANDGSEGAFKALTTAIDLARHYEAELHMISVEELPRYPATIDEVVEEKNAARERFAPLAERARKLATLKRVKLTAHVIAGHAVSSIVDFIGVHRFDLLVVGFFGHAALYNRIIGSTSDRLVDLAPCSVLVAK